jgi:peptidoglycan LD-endopeptidase LytH
VVRVGDTLGLIGNTGNARTTAPHLHFGIYRRGEGAVDPYPFVYEIRDTIPTLTADTSALGSWVRVRTPTAVLRAQPLDTATVVATLERWTPARLLGATGSWQRIELSDGLAGFVPAGRTEPAATPLRRERADSALALGDGPDAAAVIIDTVPPGEAVDILGQGSGYAYARLQSGVEGWLALKR